MRNEEFFVAAALASWNRAVQRLEQAFASVPDDELEREVAPGRNRLLYLMAHLTAVHDRMLPLLGLGERAHADLDVYLDRPDRSFADIVTPQALRRAWTDTNSRLSAALTALTPEQWLEKHTSVSDEDFAKDPHRNRLAVLQSRTNHAWSHAGQIFLVQRHFTTAFAVEQSPEQVYAAINDVRAWWTGDIEGTTDKLGGEFTYRHKDMHYSKHQVTELVPGRRVVWLIAESFLKFTKDPKEWTGMTIVFEIRPLGNGAEVRFTHVGLVPEIECFGACSGAWSSYINGNLRQRIEGKS